MALVGLRLVADAGLAERPQVVEHVLDRERELELVRALVALDAHSLALRRPITVPLIRDWLQRDIGLGNGAPPA